MHEDPGLRADPIVTYVDGVHMLHGLSSCVYDRAGKSRGRGTVIAKFAEVDCVYIGMIFVHAVRHTQADTRKQH